MRHTRPTIVMVAGAMVMILMGLAPPAHAAVPAEACLGLGGAVVPDASAPKGASCLGGQYHGQHLY